MLDPVVHNRILEDLDHIAEMAGVPKRYIEGSMTEYCPPDQMEWVKGFKQHAKQGVFGLVLIGPKAAQQMMAITGAFVRNYVDARVLALGPLLDVLKEGVPYDPTVLCVPSFQRDGMTPFQINLLWGLLEDRMLRDKQTIIGVQSIALLTKSHGSHFGQHLENHFTVSDAN